MPAGPDPAGAGRDEDPAGEPGVPVPAPDGMTGEGWLAWGDFRADQDEPPDPEEEEDPGSAAPWDYDLDAIIAGCRQVSAPASFGMTEERSRQVTADLLKAAAPS